MKAVEKSTFESVWDALANTPEEAVNLKLRAQLMHEIARAVKETALKQEQAAELCGITQPRLNDLLKGMRSCEQYGVVKKSLGEIDAFRIQHRQQRKDVMGLIVRKGLHGKKAEDLIEDFCRQHDIKDTAKFTAMTLADLSTLHSGAIIGLGITEAQLNKWLEKRP